jgi:1-deoxy-D-xylulose-5-phosphate reductoisomerase
VIGVTVLGSTGSIGMSTLDVIERHEERFRVVALTARRDADGLLSQIRRFRPDFAVLLDQSAASRLRAGVRAEGLGTEVLEGVAALETVAALPQTDFVMAAIVGAAGLLPALAAVDAGKRVLLANKEALVVAGHLFIEAGRRSGAVLLPIDSEHNAVFQCLPHGYRADPDGAGVRRILLTASGGPFRTRSVDSLGTVTPDEACAHPNWQMGRKISVDSATMMNKGLEVIEAHWLFGLSADRIEVVVHPQSVVHSLVEYVDGSLLAQLGNPDMRTPIAHALGWPDRVTAGVEPLDLFRVGHLDFERPDHRRFPCLNLAFDALRGGGDLPAVLNAANEVAVQAFLDRRVPFSAIPRAIEAVMGRFPPGPERRSIHDILAIDGEARRLTEQQLASMV